RTLLRTGMSALRSGSFLLEVGCCCEQECSRSEGGSNVIHLLLLSAFLEQLLEGDGAGGFIQRFLEPFPGAPQLRRAMRIGERGRIEHCPMNCSQHVCESDFRRGPPEQIAA